MLFSKRLNGPRKAFLSNKLSVAFIALSIGGMGAVSLSSPAQAGFRWSPPTTQEPGPMVSAVPAPEAPAADILHVPDLPAVSEEPLSPMMSEGPMPVAPLSPVEPVEKRLAPQPPQSQDMPMAMVPAAHPAPHDGDAGILEGFGENMPLLFALRQIAPETYTMSFSPAVTQDTTLSWEGGAPWPDVLQAALAEQNLEASIGDNVIRIHEKRPPMPAVPPVMPHMMAEISETAPVAASLVPQLVAPAKTADPIAKTKISKSETIMWKSAPVKAAPEDIIFERAEMIEQAPVVMMPAPMAPAPARATPVVQDAPVAPQILTAHRNMAPGTVVRPAEPMNVVFAPIMPVPMTQPVSLPAPTSATPRSLAPEQPMTSDPMAAAADKPAAPNSDVTWYGEKGQSLRYVLENWSNMVGTQLFWKAGQDYELPQTVSTEGDYTYAVQDLLEQFSGDAQRPVGHLYRQPNGPTVLVVEGTS